MPLTALTDSSRTARMLACIVSTAAIASSNPRLAGPLRIASAPARSPCRAAAIAGSAMVARQTPASIPTRSNCSLMGGVALSLALIASLMVRSSCTACS